jgi:hypothetical protein
LSSSFWRKRGDNHARKLLSDTDARSLGLEPYPDFAGVEPLFGNISAEACDVSFEFGLDGKPFYIPGPHDALERLTADSWRRWMEEDEASDEA